MFLLASVDWPAVASMATAGATLVLAVATFASVRSGNRTARAAEQSLLAGLAPVLSTSRLDDPEQKVLFADDHKVVVPGSGAAAEVTGGAIYLAISLRNTGNGLAVLDRWAFAGSGSAEPTATTRRRRRSTASRARPLHLAGRGRLLAGRVPGPGRRRLPQRFSRHRRP